MIRGVELCHTLFDRLHTSGPMAVQPHSCFLRAANLQTPLGLVTLLPPSKSLQPYSVRLAGQADFQTDFSASMVLNRAGLHRDGKLILSLADARPVDLTHWLAGPFSQAHAGAIRDFLRPHQSQGLVELVFGRSEGIYAQTAAPRLLALRQSVRDGAPAEILSESAAGLAGCGPGLTPSSDDLLCGYLFALAGLPRFRPAIGPMAKAAAARTNDISTALLLRAGEGLFSADLLSLAGCLLRGINGLELTQAMERVAAFGSSSGCDLLTGMYFGILDTCNRRDSNWSN